MTLVYCSRDFSTLRSLYPRQYWSLTTEGGAARNSYKCKYICCCVILVLLCLLLSPVLAFLYHLFPFSFVRRSLSSSSVCLFVLVYFVVRAFDYTLCVLLRIRACTCAVSFMLNFVSCSLDSNFIFRFVVVHSSQVHLVWLYDHHLRRVLVASYRLPFVLIRPYSDTGHAASDCSVGKTAPCYPPHCKSAPTTRSRLVAPSNHPAFSVPFPTLFLELSLIHI